MFSFLFSLGYEVIKRDGQAIQWDADDSDKSGSLINRSLLKGGDEILLLMAFS